MPDGSKKQARSKSAETGVRIKKTKEPAPGSYEVEEAVRKSQWAHSFAQLMSKAKKKDYLGKYMWKLYRKLLL